MRRIKKILKSYLLITGLAANVFFIYLAAGGPIIIDRWLVVTEPPIKADFIICPTGGVTANYLPNDAGWQCINTAVQLYHDGLGKKIIFTGGGVAKISEAEIYAEAAGWLGCPEDARGFEPGATNTAEHSMRLLQSSILGISKETALNIVSFDLHSRRLALCFRKAGFKKFHIVSDYMSQTADPSIERRLRVSRFDFYKPNGKSYADIFNRLSWQSDRLFYALREVAAIAFYKLKGVA
jgi:uncharacterized SAM-binding protein YcdF (DUF218 family)